jgi:hypothetical protein
MNHLKRVALATVLTSCSIAAVAQGQPVHKDSPDSTSACSYTFSSGSGNTFLKFCVTANGNITQLETPAGQEFIAKGGFSEGYGVCDNALLARYYDYADWGDSGNWQPPKTLSQSLTSVKIARTTSDGIWTLTQTFSLDSKTPSVKIVMALKNNTPAGRNVYFLRYSDIDVGDGALPHDNFAASLNSAWGWSFDPGYGNGLMLKSRAGSPSIYFLPLAQPADVPPFDTCQVPHGSHGPFLNTDGSVVLLFGLYNNGLVGPGKTLTATLIYRGM